MNKIRLLPENIRNHILSFHCNSQNMELLKDIENFVKVKKDLGEIYSFKWQDLYDESLLEDRYWLINDIIYWINFEIPTAYGYTPFMYNVWKRNIYLLTEKQIKKYMLYHNPLIKYFYCLTLNKILFVVNKQKTLVKKLINKYIDIVNDKHVNTQINIYLGMLTYEERNSLSNFLK